jgi:hypothetical protein
MAMRQQICNYILENIVYMNLNVMRNILNVVIIYVDNNYNPENRESQSLDNPVEIAISEGIIKSSNSKGINIYLDKLDMDTLMQIHNIILNRMHILNTPYIEGKTPRPSFPFHRGRG